MSLELSECSVEDIALEMGDAPFGSNLKTKDYVENGALVVQGKNVQGRNFDWSDKRHVTTEKYESLSRSHCYPDDLIFPKVGTIGKVGVLSPCEGYKQYILSTNTMRLKVDPRKANPLFVYYYFSWSKTVNLIHAMNSKSVQPVFNFTSLKKFPLKLPSLKKQNEAAKILGSLDEKIQLNQKINQTLEQMAQAIFKSWFVDFEPVKAKIAALEAGGSDEDALIAAMQAISGKDAEQLATMQAQQHEQYVQLRATAELFPSAMQESELGVVPEGWNSGTLNEIASFPNDRISTDELTLSNYVSTENMLENKRGIVNASSVSTSQTVPKYVAGHILVSNIRPYFKKIWLADSEGGRSPDVLGFEGKNNASPEFLYNVLYQDKFFEYMMLTSKGAKMPRGDKKAIMGFALTIPPVALSELFSTRVKSFYLLRRQYEQQIQTLECLRDTLLPKLLSGELNIGESISTAGELAYV